MLDNHRFSRYILPAVVLACASISLAIAQNGAKSAEAQRKLRVLEDDYWDFYQRENPEAATQLGEYRYNDRLSDYSLAHAAQKKKKFPHCLCG